MCARIRNHLSWRNNEHIHNRGRHRPVREYGASSSGETLARIGWALGVLTILFMLFDAGNKLALESHVIDATTRIGYPWRRFGPSGSLPWYAPFCTPSHPRPSWAPFSDAVKAKTGKSPAEFAKLANQRGLTKHGEIVGWLKSNYKLGHGHATAIAGVVLKAGSPPRSDAKMMDDLFFGTKAPWRKPCVALVVKLAKVGPDVGAIANCTYLNLLRAKKKLGILQPASAARLDIGIKLKGQAPAGRFEASGDCNAMVLHRVRMEDARDIDAEVLAWLERAYDAAAPNC